MKEARPAVALFSLAMFVAALGLSQEPAAPPASAEPDPGLEELKRQNARLEEQIKLLENEQELIEARFGSSDIEPLKGDVKTEGKTPIESKFLAHEALDQIAARIASEITTDGSVCKLVIFNETEFNSLYFYQAYLRQLAIIKKEYDRVLEKPAPGLEVAPLAAAATGVLSSVAKIASMFRTDLTVTSTEFTLDELALVALLAEKLGNCYKLYHPAVMPPDFLAAGRSALIAKLGELDSLRESADREVAKHKKEKAAKLKEVAKLDTQIAKKTAAIKKAKTDAEKQKLIAEKEALEIDKKSKKARVAELEAQIVRLEKVNELYLSIAGTLVAASKDSGVNKLTRLLRAEKLYTAMNTEPNDQGEVQPNAYTLLLSILDTGGSTKITKNLFTGGKLRHSGGSLAAFILFDPNGAVKSAGSFASHSGQRQFKSWNSAALTPLVDQDEQEQADQGSAQKIHKKKRDSE